MKTTSVRQVNRHSQPRAFARAIALVTTLCALAFANFAMAQISFTSSFNVTSGDWNVTENWDPEGVPTSAGTVDISANKSLRTATIPSGYDAEANEVYVAYWQDRLGTLNVNGSLTTGGNVMVGWSNNGSYPSTGTLNLGDNGTIDIGGSLTLGSQSHGIFTQGANTTVKVTGDLTVGAVNSKSSTAYTVPETGTLTLLGASSNLIIASNNASLGTFTYNGTVDTLVVPGNVNISHGGNVGTALGRFIQGANTTVRIDGTLSVGGRNSDSSTSYTVPETGKLTVGSDLYIASNDGGRGTFSYNSTVGTLDVTGDVRIAHTDSIGSATGTLDQGANSAVAISGSLTIGGRKSNTGDGGVYNLATGASVTVTGATSIATALDSRGQLNIDVGDSASGLIVGTSLAVGTDGLIDITFTEDPFDVLLGTVDNHNGIHYGLMWAGDHATTLTNLDAKLTWDDTTYLSDDFDEAVSIFYDSGTDATYVGFYISIIPEPASFALLTLGTAWLLNRRRGRRHDN